MSTFTLSRDNFYSEVEREDKRMKDKDIFQVIRESVSTNAFGDKEEEKLAVSSSYYCDAITNAIEILTNEPEAQLSKVSGKSSKPSKTYIIKCATLLGLRIFQGYPRVTSITKLCSDGFNNKSASKDEQSVYRAMGDAKHVLGDLIKPFGKGGSQSNRNIPVTKDVKNYVGDKCEIFKLTQSDMAMYFQVLALLSVKDPHRIYNEWIIDDLMKFRRLINERIYEREEEIARFHLHKDKSVFDDCLSYTGSIQG